jgi:hypothetical protein
MLEITAGAWVLAAGILTACLGSAGSSRSALMWPAALRAAMGLPLLIALESITMKWTQEPPSVLPWCNDVCQNVGEVDVSNIYALGFTACLTLAAVMWFPTLDAEWVSDGVGAWPAHGRVRCRGGTRAMDIAGEVHQHHRRLEHGIRGNSCLHRLRGGPLVRHSSRFAIVAANGG